MIAAFCSAFCVTTQPSQAMPAKNIPKKNITKKPAASMCMAKSKAKSKEKNKEKSKVKSKDKKYEVMECQICGLDMHVHDAVVTYRFNVEEIYCLDCFAGGLDSPEVVSDVSSSSESETLVFENVGDE